MSILRSRTFPAAALLAMAMALGWLVPAQSNAATTGYPSGNASNFANGNGGWSAEATYGGLCVPGLTCPQLTGTYQPSGGADGSNDGYISANSGATTLAALLSTSTLTYTSPAFTYNGAGGAAPDSVEFTVGVNSQVTQLLNLGAEVNVSARVVSANGGGAQHVVIDSVSPGATAGWNTLSGQIGARALDVGNQYRIQLILSVGGLAAVLPSGSVGFDDVRLAATRVGGNGNGGNGGNGNNGATLPPPRVIPAGVAFFHKGRLFVRVKCPRVFKPRCRIQLIAMARRGGVRFTPVRRAYLRSGRVLKRKVLGVKPKFRARVRNMAKTNKRVLVRLKIRSQRGKKKGIRFQRLVVRVRTR